MASGSLDVIDRVLLSGWRRLQDGSRGAVASVESKIRQAWSMRRRCRQVPALSSSFAGFRFPPDVIMIAVRWSLRYGLSYRDVKDLLAERGVTVITSRSIGGCSGCPHY